MKLNDTQAEAINSCNKKVLLVASAGSGKTSVLIEKVYDLIVERKTDPKSVLMLTFSNKAANHLKQRLMDRVGSVSKEMTVSTFHAFALKLIKQFLEYTQLSSFFKIINPEERNRYLATVANEVKVSRYMLREYKENVGKYKDGRLTIPPHFQALHKRLHEKLESMRMIEIDDLIPIAMELIKKNSQVSMYLQNKYQYILIDEYQDINEQQYEFVSPLIESATQFVAVGDDDQCIYEWRGSKPGLMRELFEKEEVQTFFLVQNYRSQKNVIEFSNRIISHNQNRIRKNMIATKPPSSIPEFNVFTNKKEEAEHIGKTIKSLIENSSTKLTEIAILVRNDSQSPAIISELNRHKIPFINHNSKIEMAKWLLDYLREIALTKPNLSRLVNYPKRIIDQFLYDRICAENKLDPSDPIQAIEKMYVLDPDFPDAAIFRARYETIKFLTDIQSSRTVLEVIDVLYENILNSGDHLTEDEVAFFDIAMAAAREYVNLNEDPSLNGFCDYFELMIDEMARSADDGVHVMTIHKAKGLEFDCVFLPGLDVGNFPNPFFVTNQDRMEAERRLLYVGITRAKEHLYVSSGDEQAFDPRLLDGFVSDIAAALKDESIYERSEKKRVPIDIADKIVDRIDQKAFTEQSRSGIDRSDFKPMTKNTIMRWIKPECPMLSREIESICENTEVVLSDIVRKLEPSRPTLLNNRSFIYGTLKLIMDQALGGRAGKITEYLRFNGVNQGLELIKLHEALIKSKRVALPFSANDLSRLVEYKKYLDALHHQFERTKRKNTSGILDTFREKDHDEKIVLIMSPIVFLNHTTLRDQALSFIESALKG